jgi:hypothetical protein
VRAPFHEYKADLPISEFEYKRIADESFDTACDLDQSFEPIKVHLKTRRTAFYDLMTG